MLPSRLLLSARTLCHNIIIAGPAIPIPETIRQKATVFSIPNPINTQAVLRKANDRLAISCAKNPDSAARIIVFSHGKDGTLTMDRSIHPYDLISHFMKGNDLKNYPVSFVFNACHIGHGFTDLETQKPLVAEYERSLQKNSYAILYGAEKPVLSYSSYLSTKRLLDFENKNGFEQIIGLMHYPMPFYLLLKTDGGLRIFHHQTINPKTVQDLNTENCQKHIIQNMQNFTKFLLESRPDLTLEDQRGMGDIISNHSNMVRFYPEIARQYQEIDFLTNNYNNDFHRIGLYIENGINPDITVLKDSLPHNEWIDGMIFRHIQASSRTALEAIKSRKFDEAKKLINAGVNIDCRVDDTSSLYVACESKNSDMVKFLLEKGVDTYLYYHTKYADRRILINIFAKMAMEYQNCASDVERKECQEIIDALIASPGHNMISVESFTKEAEEAFENDKLLEKFKEGIDFVKERIKMKTPDTSIKNLSSAMITADVQRTL